MAQALAIALNDEPRATRARELRDELGRVAAETLDELESLGLSSILPTRHEWKAHHESFFQSFSDACSDADVCLKKDGVNFSPAIMLALRAWRERSMVEGNEEGTQEETSDDSEITEPPLWGVDNGQESVDDGGLAEEVAPGEEETSHLATRTRIYDTVFENKASTYVEIESTAGLRLLTKALNIAREAWSYFCLCYQWSIWRDFFPSGPHTILLETPMVQTYIDHWRNDNTPGAILLGASSALRCVTPLRNAVCHYMPEQWDVVGYDRLLQNTQALVVALSDEPRALQVRELRDELRRLAAKTRQEIESLGFASVTPFRREWNPHHEWFLQNVAARADHGVQEYHHGPAVWLAVEAWR
ncbi:hypothetical protein PG997_010177 [Apiospora hydei]|uniref:Uncharacterized protein n=1 Tax=Apiospora hydei TaxID=1337664 RepID=A0ABR1W006_9PEZI